MHHGRNIFGALRISRDVGIQVPTGCFTLGVLVIALLIGCADDAQNAGEPSGEDIVDAGGQDTTPAGDDVVPLVDTGEPGAPDGTASEDQTTGDTAARRAEDALGGDVESAPVDVPLRAGDTDPTAQPCNCLEDQVWLVGACVPTPLLGCGEPCSVDDPAGCSGDWQCDPAAATPLCTTSSSTPACIPPTDMAFADGDLRIHPTEATVGEEVSVSVQGGLFYIGALFWMMRVGDELLEPLIDWEAACTISIPWTPTQAGTFPVHVAYGASETPNMGGTLAGFISVDAPSQTTQPGFSCTSETTCAQAAPYTCTCQAGQCACTTDD